MGSPYQLILLNLLHVQEMLVGTLRVLVFIRRFAHWRGAMEAWLLEQQRQQRILLVLYKQIGGRPGIMHRFLLALARFVGWIGGVLLIPMPLWVIRTSLTRADRTLTSGFERAGHQIAIAEWQSQSSAINPPKALLELADDRREWPSQWGAPLQFL